MIIVGDYHRHMMRDELSRGVPCPQAKAIKSATWEGGGRRFFHMTSKVTE